MSDNNLLILLGNQLFGNSEISSLNPKMIFMAEDFELCTYEKHHKLKLLMVLGAMREKRDEIKLSGLPIEYQDINHHNFRKPYEHKLKDFCKNKIFNKIVMFEIEDKNFENKILNFAEQTGIEIEFVPTPMFLIERTQFKSFINHNKALRMANFYKDVRRQLKLLLDDNLNPIGNKWSFDDENRKKIPKGELIPRQYKAQKSKYINILKPLIERTFSDHPGNLSNAWMPLTRAEAFKTLENFLQKKFVKFGPYEDAIQLSDNFLFHSGLSSSINLGLITPKEIIDQIISFTDKTNVPLNSVEGFVRQVVGWREFIRGIYQNFSDQQLKSNYFSFSNSLKNNWYQGTTGIPPLDDAIKYSVDYGYTHHINRLMVIGNIMTLCEVNPKHMYSWFMEMFIDSSEWVMTPNVYGMASFADGGIFSTKPYICGSNYILKMSNYPKGPWCETMDGLYWRFVSKNINLIKKNARMPFLESTLKKMDPTRKKRIFDCAESFISKNCNINQRL